MESVGIALAPRDESLELDVSSVSHHLVILRRTDFVSAQRVCRTHMYTVGGSVCVEVGPSTYLVHADADGARIEIELPLMWLPRLQAAS